MSDGNDKTKLRLEIAHVLFMDIVGYSKLLTDEQSETLHELNRIVLGTKAAQEADAAGCLLRLPTGDGMALVFTSSVEAPVECALEISRALRSPPSLPLRMGIHSGPVQQVEDVNGRANVTGAGINIAQRVMDCGDAGHILVSRRVADDLAGSRRWQPFLHDLGNCEVKHGVVVGLVNLYAEATGNPAPPQKLGAAPEAARPPAPASEMRRPAVGWLFGAGLLLATVVLVAETQRSSLLWLAGAVLLLAAVALLAIFRPWSGTRQTKRTTVVPVPSAVPAAPSIPPAQALLEKSIAVLSFDNFSEDKDSAFFADGVQNEVLTNLAKVADLKVISRSSVMHYKEVRQRNLREIGRALGVAYVVEGSVQRAGNKIRVTAQLIDTRTDAHRWAEHYDRDLADVFAIQSDIAQSIAKQLQIVISPEERAAMTEVPTHDEQAYQLYLRAVVGWYDLDLPRDTHSQVDEILGLLRQATARDPGFVRAIGMLSLVEAVLYRSLEKTPAQAEIVRGLVETVARLRPDSADAHKAAGVYHSAVIGDISRAREEHVQAAQLSPNDAEVFYFLGRLDAHQGNWEDALTNLRKALSLDPENTISRFIYTDVLKTLRRYAEACTGLDRRLAVRPQAMWPHLLKGSIFLDWRGDSRAARAEVAQLAADFDAGRATSIRLDCGLFERDFAAAARDLAACPLDEIESLPRTWYEGRIALLQGDHEAAEKAFQSARTVMEKKVLAEPTDASSLMYLARIDAYLGHKEQALAGGRQALALPPPGRDTGMQSGFARLLVSLGEHDEAIGILQKICGQPDGPTYGYLRFDPLWDPLRGDPRFESLVVSLAPKP